MWSFDRMRQRSICFKGGGGGGSTAPQRIITDDMIAQAEVSTKEWNDYENRMLPMIQKVAADKTRGSANLENNLRGQVSADMAQAQKNLNSMNPVSPFKNAAATSSLAKATASGMASATQNAKDFQAKELGGLVAVGRGQQAQDMGSLDTLAKSSSQAAMTQAKAESDAYVDSTNAETQLYGKAFNAGAKAVDYGMSKGWFKSGP